MGKTQNFNRDYYTRQAISKSGITNDASQTQQWLREEASRHYGKIAHLASPPNPFVQKPALQSPD